MNICLHINSKLQLALHLIYLFRSLTLSWLLHNSHLLFVYRLIELSYTFHTLHESLDSFETEVRDRGEYAYGKHSIPVRSTHAVSLCVSALFSIISFLLWSNSCCASICVWRRKKINNLKRRKKFVFQIREKEKRIHEALMLCLKIHIDVCYHISRSTHSKHLTQCDAVILIILQTRFVGNLQTFCVLFSFVTI